MVSAVVGPVCIVLRAAVRHRGGEGDEEPAGRRQAGHGVRLRHERHSTTEGQRSGRNWEKGIADELCIKLAKNVLIATVSCKNLIKFQRYRCTCIISIASCMQRWRPY